MSAERKSLTLAIVFAVLALLCAGAISGPHGPGASSDSVTYLSVARNVATGQGFHRFDGRPYVAWPPLYPLTLATLVRTGLLPMQAAELLQAIVFAGALAALVAILYRTTGSLAWAAVGGALVFASPRALVTFNSAWSEGTFVALVLLAFWLAERSGPTPRDRDVLGLGIVCGAAILTRYIGVALAGALAVWLVASRASLRTRTRQLAILTATTSVGPALWLLRNLMQAETAVGRRGAGYATLAGNAQQLLTNISEYLNLTGDPPVTAFLFVAGLVLLGLPALGLVGWWRRRRSGAPAPAAVLLAALFVLLYAGVLVIIASWTPVSRLSRTRWGTPLWLPLVILAVTAAAAAWQRAGRGGRAALLATVLAFTGYGLHASGQRFANVREEGLHGLNRVQWQRSPMIEALKHSYSGQTVLSNRPHVIYLQALIPASYSPRKRNYRSTVLRSNDLEALNERAAREGSVQLAWFWDYPGGYGYYKPLEIAEEGVCLTVRSKYPDGVLFEVFGPDHCPITRAGP